MMTRTTFRAPWAAATVALSMILVGGDALAQRGAPRRETPVEALLRRADAAREATDYSTALTLYQQAYTDGHQPEVLFNIGRMHLQLRHWQEGRAALQSFLENIPDAPNRAMTEQLIRDAEREMAAASAANANVDPNQQALDAQRAQREREEAERRRREQRPPPPIVTRPAPVWPWAIVGAGGALAIGAGITGGLTIASEGALFSQHGCVRVSGGIDCPTSASGAVGQARLMGGLTLGLGIGAALVAAGGVAAVIATRPARVEASAGVTAVYVAPHGGGDGASVVVGGRL
jgi:hypothetical protein